MSRPFPAARCLAAAALLLACASAVPDPGGRFEKGPYLQNPGQRAITVCWVTSGKSSGVLLYRASDAPGQPYVTVRETAPARYHRVRLTGLRPYTRYRYVVASGGERRYGSFLTAAPPGRPFRFVAYGDTRTQADRHAEVVARVRAYAPDFVLQTGDLVEDGHDESQWEVFFAVTARLLRSTAYYPALGNHERDGAPYFRYFDVPREYAFDYGNARFIVMDSNRPPAEHADQEQWLRRELRAARGHTWRIVALHATLHTCAPSSLRRRAAERLRARLDPILRAGRVPLVISGHAHNYQHHLADGVHYVVSGGGGAPLVGVRPDTPYLVTARKAYHHCEIRVDGRDLELRAVQPDGSVIEQFQIRAPR